MYPILASVRRKALPILTLLFFFLFSPPFAHSTPFSLPLTSPANYRPICTDDIHGPNSPNTAISWIKLMAFTNLPLVNSYRPGDRIICMPDITHPKSSDPEAMKSGICATAGYKVITAVEVKKGLKELNDAGCKMCGVYDGLVVKWTQDRGGCKGVCKKDIGGEDTGVIDTF